MIEFLDDLTSGCVFDMVSLFWHLLQFYCVLQAPANDTERKSVQCYRSFVMAEELLQFLPWSTALSDLPQMPLDVGTVFCCFFCSHGAVYNPFLLLFNGLSFLCYWR